MRKNIRFEISTYRIAEVLGRPAYAQELKGTITMHAVLTDFIVQSTLVITDTQRTLRNIVAETLFSYKCFPVCPPRETLLRKQNSLPRLGSKNVS